ncbi:MAG: thiamine phosphate synthase [Acidobacteriota bacterium]|nr:thiamine phosphate synthase [Acidobacteriota bacterium]
MAARFLPRVYPILDTATLARLGFDPVRAAAAMVEAGARILQFRHKGFWSRKIFTEAEEVARLCREASVTYIVNDRADYAAILHAGLHLGQEDLRPADARTLTGGTALIGLSTHSPGQMSAAAAEPVDYVAFGPVFSTASKENPDPTVGLEGLRAVRALTTRPLVAIGGITQHNAAQCLEAGADAVAIIGGLLPEPCTAEGIRSLMREWQGF